MMLISCTPSLPASISETSIPIKTETQPSVTIATATALLPTETLMPLTLTSPAFQEGGEIPRDFACTGDNKSPELDWSEPPAGTQSFAIVFNDPDAGSRGFVHWVVYNIPADARSMPANVPAKPEIHDTAVHGSNGWGRMDYGGPCPPEGSMHNYVFTLYALDVLLDLQPGATKAEFEEAARVHVLATATLTASFSR
jgi:Raf kinase inhibitor-like YbhB/YbcL family protein